jgi:DNA repair exonuclease SbcCD ATPase subunit
MRAENLTLQHKKAMEAKAALEAKRDKLERLLEYFGPKGVSAKLLDESVGPFEAKMNSILTGWGFQCKLQFAPFLMSVSFAGASRFFPLRTMSESQKFMFRIAFQVALAKTTGFNFVFVDAADMFLDANRSLLYRNLMAAGLDQIIVLQSDLRREIPKAKDSAFFMLTLDKSGDVPTTKVERL